MATLINLIVYLVVLGLVWWLISLLPLPGLIAGIVRILFVILVLWVILAALGIVSGPRLPTLRL